MTATTHSGGARPGLPEVRPPTAAEYPRWRHRVGTAFGRDVPEEEIRREQEAADLRRALGAWDAGAPVATAVAFDMPLTVPGGPRLQGAGISMVTVAPTHRRRGLLTAMMARLIDDARARGDEVAMLFASEGTIYGRFGFGIAAHTVGISLTPQVLPRRPEPRSAPLRLVTPRDAQDLLPRIDDAAAAATTGAVGVPPFVWSHLGLSRPGSRPPLQIAVLGRPGAERGYVTYRVAVDWRSGAPAAPDGVVTVEHLVGLDTEAVLALWDHVLGIDLVRRCEARLRPVDDPLLSAAADRLSISVEADEPLWIRLVDVPGALRRRRWNGSGTLALHVDLPDGGQERLRLVVDDGTATVQHHRGGADLHLQLSQLSAVYLGATPVRDLVRVGHVVEHVPGAAARFDALLATWPAPWNGWHF